MNDPPAASEPAPNEGATPPDVDPVVEEGVPSMDQVNEPQSEPESMSTDEPIAASGTATSPPTPPAPPLSRPSLVVSADGDYWNEGEVTEVADGIPTFSVDTSVEFQTWHGWGGTFNEAGWEALLHLEDAERQRAMELLFDEHDGLGLDWGRIPMGPNHYAVERYSLSAGPGEFSIEHDRIYLIPYIQAAQAYKADIKFWASPWTPPPWMKTGETENGGHDKGAFDPQYYQDYADYFVSWIQAYEERGIPIDHVMPQNEPGFVRSTPSCAFGPTTDTSWITTLESPTMLGTFVDSYLFPALDAAGLSTGIWFGTLSNNQFFEDYWGDMMDKASADRIVGAGLQWETSLRVAEVAARGYLVMQSEHKPGNYPWLSDVATSPDDATYLTFLSNMAPNNHSYAVESWDLFRQWIEFGVHIYSAWNMVLDTRGMSLDVERPWPQNALLAVDREAQQLQVTPYYYAFRHLAQFVDVGAQRVEISGDGLAFKNPDGSVVAVMRTTSAESHILSIDGTLLAFEAAGNGWVTVLWQGR